MGEGRETDVGHFFKNLLLFYVVLIEVLRLEQKVHIDNTGPIWQGNYYLAHMKFLKSRNFM